jgi:hypothetical protein
VFHQRGDSCAHVLALKQRRCYLVNNLVGGAYTALQESAYHPLSRGVGQGRTIRKSLCERPGLQFKCIIRLLPPVMSAILPSSFPMHFSVID